MNEGDADFDYTGQQNLDRDLKMLAFFIFHFFALKLDSVQ